MEYLMQIACSDLAHFSRCLLDRLLAQDGVADVNSSFVLRTVKAFRGMPLPGMWEARPRKARFWNRLDAHDIQSPCFKACHLACCTRSRVRCRLARARHHPRDCATSVRDERFARCRGCESTVNGDRTSTRLNSSH